MTRSARLKAAPAPPRQEALTAIEAWYLECLRILSVHLKRPPSLPELAKYCKRTITPVLRALQSCEHKGHARQDRRSRKWHPVDGVS
jgi:DNA-binding IclR family transcriptional regulator